MRVPGSGKVQQKTAREKLDGYSRPRPKRERHLEPLNNAPSISPSPAVRRQILRKGHTTLPGSAPASVLAIVFLSVIPEGNLLSHPSAATIAQEARSRFPSGMTERKAKTDKKDTLAFCVRCGVPNLSGTRAPTTSSLRDRPGRSRSWYPASAPGLQSRQCSIAAAWSRRYFPEL